MKDPRYLYICLEIKTFGLKKDGWNYRNAMYRLCKLPLILDEHDIY